MHRLSVAAALLLAGTLAACVTGQANGPTMAQTGGPTLGGYNYAPEYDFSEFWAATDGRTFRVVFAGNPFPALPVER